MRRPSRNSVFLSIDEHYIQLSAADPILEQKNLKYLLADFLFSCLENHNLDDIPLNGICYKFVLIGQLENTDMFFAKANNAVVYFSNDNPEENRDKLRELLRLAT